MFVKNSKRTRQDGMTLVEVLVTLVILAFSLLGIAGMLMFSNKANNSSYAKQQAVQCVYDIFDRIRANSTSAINGNYNINNIGSNGIPTTVSTPSPLCDASVCTPTQMAAYDTWYWLNYDVSKLPSGSGSITTALSTNGSGNTIVTVTVQWDDSSAQAMLGASSSVSTANPNYVQLSIQSQI